MTFEPDLSLWEPWTPDEVTRVLSEVEAPWYVAGGWSIELFLGGGHREHTDLEIGVPSMRFSEVAEALASLELFVLTAPGQAAPLDDAWDRLDDTHQTWARDPATGHWVLDVLREPSLEDTWVYRRDARIRLPFDRLIDWTGDGIPYCRPEIALLFKAKQVQPKDQSDFDAVLARLEPHGRRWLRDALEFVHPDHPWQRRLDEVGT